MELMVIILLGIVTVGFIARTYAIGNQLEQLRQELLKFRRLETQLDVLKHQVNELLKGGGSKVPERVEPRTVEVSQPAPPTPAATQAQEVRKPEPVPASSSSFRESVAEEPKPSRTREELEAFVGGKLLNRIGALALIIGIGFFLKYAFDRNWISETVRVFIGAVAGIVCLAVAYRTHWRDLKIFAQGLVGAGIAILYLSIYASFNFYALVPQWVAFVLMSIVTTLALYQALYYNSLAVALFGWAGGFLTPIMLSTGHANEIGLFTYLALLNVGLLGMLLKKHSWSVLEPLTLVATWIMYAAWHTRYYSPQDLWITIFFVSLFWLLFYALDVFQLLRAPEEPLILHHAIAIINGVIFFSALYLLIDQQHHEWMGGVTFGIGLIYFTTILVTKFQKQLADPVISRYLVSAIVLLAAATAIQFHDFTIVIVWSLEALILVWCGLHWRLEYVWGLAAGLFLFGLLKFSTIEGAFAIEQPREFVLLLNQRSLTLAVACLSVGLAAWLMVRYCGDSPGEALERTRDTLNFAWCLLLFTLLTVETNDYFRLKMLDQPYHTLEAMAFTRLMALTVLWMACAFPLAWLGFHYKILPVAIASLFMLALAVILATARGISYEPISDFTPVYNLRVGAMLFILAGMMGFDRLMNNRTEGWAWLSEIRNLVDVALVIFLLLLLTAETRDFFEKQISAASTIQNDIESSDLLARLHNLQQLMLSSVWLLYSVALMAIGIWRSIRSFRIVAFVLFGITILKIFTYDLSFLETLYKIFSFIGLGVILLAMSYVYQRYKDVIFGTTTPTR